MRLKMTSWLLSVAGGFVSAVSALAFGAAGLAVLVAVGIAAGRMAQRREAAAGLLTGLGGTGVLALLAANARCALAGEGRGACLASGSEFGLVVAGMVFAAGVAVTLVSFAASIRDAREP